MNRITYYLGQGANLAIIIMVIAILFILFSPISAATLDVLLLTNFSLALFVLLLTFYVNKPVEFSTFPSILLITTLFRLALNLSATRLILSEADAGKVINAIGEYVVSGNYVIGVIIFLILVVVQYLVITSGAQRVAEVAARFTLDSMPGQQMSIDADLNMGFIDQQQAQQRRKSLEKEAGFYGAMDGASKFVKGDAIAGIIIMLINIIGGFAVGVAQHGMPWHKALELYTLLTIGDGIVTQIPALVISVGTGIIITRSSSDSRLSREMMSQFAAYPNILFILAATVFLLSFLPGFPAWSAISLSLLFVSIAGLIKFSAKNPSHNPLQDETSDSLYDMMKVELLSIEYSPSLNEMLGTKAAVLLERIEIFRKQYALSSGLIIPNIKIIEEKNLAEFNYRIFLQGSKIGEGELLPEHWLAIHPGGEALPLDGKATQDPAYHLPAIWINDQSRRKARENGYTVVDPVTVLMTHFSELVKQNSAALLVREEVERLINHLRQEKETLVDELIPNILSLVDIQKVLQALLKEKVSIRAFATILEVLVDIGRNNKDIDELTSRIRQQLGNIICEPLTSKDGYLHVITLDSTIEQTLYEGIRKPDEVSQGLALDPRFTEQFIKKVLQESEKMAGQNYLPVLLCAPEIRASLRKLTERVLPHLHILALNEVPTSINLKSFSAVSL